MPLLPVRDLPYKRWGKTALLAALPVVLYAVIAEQLSWRPRTLRQGQSQRLQRHRTWSPSVTFSPDGTLLATLNPYTEVWDVRTGKLIEAAKKLTGGGPLIFSPDGKLLAGGGDRTVKVWNSQSGEIERALVHKESGYARLIPLAFSPDSKTLACVHATRTLEIWDVTKGKLLHRLPAQSTSVEEVVFSPDGKTMVSGADDGTVIWWDTRTGKLLRRLNPRPDWVGIIVFSPDAKIMATGRGHSIKIWDTHTGALLRTITNPGVGYNPGLFSADGRSLIRVGAGSSPDFPVLTSQDVQTGNVTRLGTLRTLQLHGDSNCALSPDGSTLATGEADGAVKLWRVK